MPPHLHYAEVYGGGLQVLFAHDPNRDWLIDDEWKLKNGEEPPAYLRGCSEVVNDVDGSLMNFWRVLAMPGWFEQFQRTVEAVPFSEYHHNGAVAEMWPYHDNIDSISGICFVVQQAVSFFVMTRQSLAGRQINFAPVSKTRTRRGMNEQASAWLSVVDGLPEVHERLRRVLMFSEDGIKFIRKQDGLRTLFYCDPPYLADTRTADEVYEHEMTIWQHRQLLDVLSAIEGRFILSGYRNGLYDNYAEKFGWRRLDFDLPNNAAGGKTKRRMTECVWMNYEPKGSGRTNDRQ